MDIEKLEKLSALKDKGLISEGEFNEQKAKLLSSKDKTPKNGKNYTKTIIISIVVVLLILLSIPFFKGVFNGISDYASDDFTVENKFKEMYVGNCHDSVGRENVKAMRMCEQVAEIVVEELDTKTIEAFVNNKATPHQIEVLENLESNILRNLVNN